MKRREFISALSVAAGWPLVARAQQPALPVVGFLTTGERLPADWLAAFRAGLSEQGYIEGRNVAVEMHATGQYDRLPALASELVRRRVDVIYAVALPATLAAKAATATTPIVFTVGGDPVELGLVTSLNRPGGNLTGLTAFFGELAPKRLELLRELVPTANIIGLLVNPNNLNSEARSRDVRQAALAVGQNILIVSASSEREVIAAFATFVKQRAGAMIVSDDPFFGGLIEQIITLSASHAMPAIYPFRLHTVMGGLMSYGTSLTEQHRMGGLYVGRILKGEKPADLPVLQPTKFELVINLNTAKSLGLTVPPMVLARADEVIE